MVDNLSKDTRTTESRLNFYGKIFLCLTTCVVPLYLVDDLSTDSFLLLLTRFMTIREKTKTILTKNGTDYIIAERELSIILKDLNQTKIGNSLINKRVTWKFNLSSS